MSGEDIYGPCSADSVTDSGIHYAGNFATISPEQGQAVTCMVACYHLHKVPRPDIAAPITPARARQHAAYLKDFNDPTNPKNWLVTDAITALETYANVH